MRGPSEGLHEGPALGRGGRGKGATPQPMAGPRGRDRHAAPPLGRQEASPGDQGAPPTPPPPPTQAQERTEPDRRNRGPTPPPKRPLHPGCGGTTAEAGAHTPCLPPADSGPATPRLARTERPYQRPAEGKRGRDPGQGGFPPPPPPSPHHAALTRRRPTGPRPTPAAARQRPRHEYTPRGHAGGNGRQADARRGGRAGGPAPHPPPPAPSPAREPQARPSAPLKPRGRLPPPRRDRGAGGGDAAGPAPVGVAAAGRAHTSVPEQRSQRYSMGAAPHITPP